MVHRIKVHFAIVLSALTMAGPARTWAASTATPATNARPTPRPTPGPRVRMTDGEAQALVKEISARVEQIRGLKFKTPVDMKIIDGKTARANMKSKIEPRDEEQMKYTQQAYVHLGLVPPNTDLLTNYLKLAEEGVDGYYEPGSKIFYLLDHVSAKDVRGVMAHELTHALEDQHYDLKAVSKLAEGDDDRGTAISALIEGSAMLVMLSYLDQEMRKKGVLQEMQNESQRADRLKLAPTFTQQSLMLPYTLGFTFLLRGDMVNWLRGGIFASNLDYAYKHPPQATRHILHPGLYWRNMDKRFTTPRLPDMSRLLGEGWTKATEGSIGELGLAVLTGSRINFNSSDIFKPTKWTNGAAAGTVGDRFQLYVNGDQKVTVLVTGWESVSEADEFERVMRPRTGKRAYIYGANYVLITGNFGDKSEALAAAAFEGAHFWPRDESVGQWPPPARGPDEWLGED
jgi:hypothetical protein